MWSAIAFLLQFILQYVSSSSVASGSYTLQYNKIVPKVFIIGMFVDEGNAWFNIPEFNILAKNITVPGLSPLFPQVHCTADENICSLVTGEAEINAAVTLTTLVHSPLFDLRRTYFLIAGIAGMNPKMGTIGGVTFARYAVQVALQKEIDAREKPDNFSTGYVPQGSTSPDEYPQSIYGTEVFEVNDNLRQLAVQMAEGAKLADNTASQELRAKYASNPDFAAGAAPPSVLACDTATSDVFWSGALLGGAFENTTTLFTNGTGVYCTTQQEDNATLEALLRGALIGHIDFSRVIIMRTASNFDRPFDGQSAADHLFGPAPGFASSVQNIHLAGVRVVEGIVAGWEKTFKGGVKPNNYIGDIFGTLGGNPPFGPGSVFADQKAKRRSRGASLYPTSDGAPLERTLR